MERISGASRSHRSMGVKLNEAASKVGKTAQRAASVLVKAFHANGRPRAVPLDAHLTLDPPSPAVVLSLPQTPQDIEFDTIVNMFDDPVAFLVMAGQGVEDVLAFSDRPDKESHLIEVFKTQVVPRLPHKLIGNRPACILFDGDVHTLRAGLGRGSFGVVVEYSTSDGQSIAVKTDRENNFRKMMEELRSHFYSQGRTLTPETRGIAALRGAVFNEDGTVMIVQACMPDGNYFELNKKLDWAWQQGLLTDPQLIAAIHATALRDAAKGLIEANSNAVHHRDMKDDNLVFAGGKARICDFGVSQTNVKDFADDAIRLGYMAQQHLRIDGEVPQGFDRDELERKSPQQVLREMPHLFKANGVGGPHVRAVIEALTRLDRSNTQPLEVACKAYLDAAAAAQKKGPFHWKELKQELLMQRV